MQRQRDDSLRSLDRRVSALERTYRRAGRLTNRMLPILDRLQRLNAKEQQGKADEGGNLATIRMLTQQLCELFSRAEEQDREAAG